MLSKSELVANCFLMSFLFIGVLVSSCTPTTGTRIPLSQAGLAKIKRIGILVKDEGGFSVRVSREKMTGTGAILFGLVGAGVEAGARSSADQRREKECKPIISHFDAYSDQTIHLFRSIPSTYSENKHPSIPKITIQLAGAKRRFGISFSRVFLIRQV